MLADMRSRPLYAAALALGVLIIVAPVESQAPPPVQPLTYTIENLGTTCVATPARDCEGAGSRAFAVNNWGQVVGISHRVAGEGSLASLALRGFRTAPNQAINPMSDVLGFGGPELAFRAYSINDSGTAVGVFSEFVVWFPYVDPMSYEATAVTAAFRATANAGPVDFRDVSLLGCPSSPPLPFGCWGSAAYSINNTGVFVGKAAELPKEGLFTVSRGFLYANHAIEDLGSLGGFHIYSEARDINDAGLAVGFAAVVSPFGGLTFPVAVRFGGGVAASLGAPEDSSGVAYAVNNLAQVAGQAGHAFFHDPTIVVAPGGSALQDLGTLCSGADPCSSAAYDLNDTGWIVGESQISSADETMHAFLYRLDQGHMRDLNDLLAAADRTQWILTDARGVNEYGQIVGTGRFQSQTRAYLMTPPLDDVFVNAKTLVQVILETGLTRVAQSLIAILSAAEMSVRRQDYPTAALQVNAYDNEVRALVEGRVLTETDGTKLRAGASLLRNLIEEEQRRRR